MSDFLQAARHTDKATRLPHQDAAWHYAWSCLTDEQRTEFLTIFRASVDPKVGDVPNTWKGICTAAMQAGAKHPELVAAQWALESGFGKHPSGSNNFWGLKGPGTVVKTQEYEKGSFVTKQAEFRDFATIRDGVSYLVDRWYKDATIAGTAYKGVNNAVDREDAAVDLARQGYATDPRYARRLIDLMNENAPRKRPTQDTLKQEVGIWKTKVDAINLSQPDANTCQAACIGMAVGDRDIRGIRDKLRQLGIPGSPSVMASVIKEYPSVNYSYEANASLADVRRWLQDGELLITHGWFTVSGHVIVLDGCTENRIDVKDPWSEFNAATWKYDYASKFYDGFYSDALIYAACVASVSCRDAKRIYQAHRPVEYKRTGMWVHRFRA